MPEDRCYIDKKGIFHACKGKDNFEKDCEGCKHEHIIADTFWSLCHWCGEIIESRHPRIFCDEICRNKWLSARVSADGLKEGKGGLYWSEGFGACPIYTLKELEECHKML